MNLVCLIGPCRRWAKWVPVLVGPPKQSERGDEAQTFVLGVVVCDQCKEWTTPTTLLSGHQRMQLASVVQARGKAPIDWRRARFRWVDIHSPDPEIRTVVEPIAQRQAAEAVADPSQLH